MKIIDWILLRDINLAEQIEIGQLTGVSTDLGGLLFIRLYLFILGSMIVLLIVYASMSCVLELI